MTAPNDNLTGESHEQGEHSMTAPNNNLAGEGLLKVGTA